MNSLHTIQESLPCAGVLAVLSWQAALRDPLPTHNFPCMTCSPADTASGCWAGPQSTLCKEVLPSIATLTLGSKSSSSLWSLAGCPIPESLARHMALAAGLGHKLFQKDNSLTYMLFFLAENIQLDLYIEIYRNMDSQYKFVLKRHF